MAPKPASLTLAKKTSSGAVEMNLGPTPARCWPKSAPSMSRLPSLPPLAFLASASAEATAKGRSRTCTRGVANTKVTRKPTTRAAAHTISRWRSSTRWSSSGAREASISASSSTAVIVGRPPRSRSSPRKPGPRQDLMQGAGVEALFQHEEHEEHEEHEGRAARAGKSPPTEEIGCAPERRAFVSFVRFVFPFRPLPAWIPALDQVRGGMSGLGGRPRRSGGAWPSFGGLLRTGGALAL